MGKLNKILEQILKLYDMTEREFKSRQQDAHVSMVRRHFAHSARQEGYTWREIGCVCGGRNLTTMINLCKTGGWRKKKIKKEKGGEAMWQLTCSSNLKE